MIESEPAAASSPNFRTSTFRKSTFCATDACVEVALDHDVLVRDGKDRGAPSLTFSGAAWVAFLGGVINGEFSPGA
ncbi:DUF397 domain-containing protein [Pseudonocardia lacus]|uniref:DUF397 domain-containing protein n=1 Tax=Pseudonocardia lacus TaxID=2835865 RepID=UPI001BDDA434|nr:DUF397 domain-containing protein [Pseudonocardia lacus]